MKKKTTLPKILSGGTKILHIRLSKDLNDDLEKTLNVLNSNNLGLKINSPVLVRMSLRHFLTKIKAEGLSLDLVKF